MMLLRSFLLYCYLIFLLLKCVASVEPWVGSRLGTNKYNREYDAIELGKIDYQKAQEMIKNPNIPPRKELLCVSFVGGGMDFSSIVQPNILLMKSNCDWALVIYDGTPEQIKSICDTPNIQPYTVHCARSIDTYHNQTGLSDNQQKLSIPKTVLYQSLLPLLPKYEKVFLMDEDISLEDFNFSLFMDIWACGFEGAWPPLIVQPLIFESTQYWSCVNENSWRTPEWKDAVSSTTGYIEQQTPLFDSIFFEWFVRRVLSQTKHFSLQYGIDWGHDRSWCNAAVMYMYEVLHYPRKTPSGDNNVPPQPCGLITALDTSVHHRNTMSMKIIRGNAAIFRKHAFQIVQRYIELFPTWVGIDMHSPNNPQLPENINKFHQVRKINETCVAERWKFG